MASHWNALRRGRQPGPLDGLLADFAAFLEGAAWGPEADRVGLTGLLDRLALARRGCWSAAHPSGTLPPRHDDGRRERIAARFPGLGLYTTIEPQLSDESEEAVIGDAIDDLVDISAELERVAWYLAHEGPQDAARYYAWSFDVHWGRHLRELQLYLHALGE